MAGEAIRAPRVAYITVGVRLKRNLCAVGKYLDGRIPGDMFHMAVHYHKQMKRPDHTGAYQQKQSGAKPPKDAFHIINVPPEK